MPTLKKYIETVKRILQPGLFDHRRRRSGRASRGYHGQYTYSPKKRNMNLPRRHRLNRMVPAISFDEFRDEHFSTYHITEQHNAIMYNMFKEDPDVSYSPLHVMSTRKDGEELATVWTAANDKFFAKYREIPTDGSVPNVFAQGKDAKVIIIDYIINEIDSKGHSNGHNNALVINLNDPENPILEHFEPHGGYGQGIVDSMGMTEQDHQQAYDYVIREVKKHYPAFQDKDFRIMRSSELFENVEWYNTNLWPNRHNNNPGRLPVLGPQFAQEMASDSIEGTCTMWSRWFGTIRGLNLTADPVNLVTEAMEDIMQLDDLILDHVATKYVDWFHDYKCHDPDWKQDYRCLDRETFKSEKKRFNSRTEKKFPIF